MKTTEQAGLTNRESNKTPSDAEFSSVSLVIGPSPARAMGLIQGGGSGGGGGTGGGGAGGRSQPSESRSEFWKRPSK